MAKESSLARANNNTPPLDSQILVDLVSIRMPFGKYKDQFLCDLPEPYLLWFHRKGFSSREDRTPFVLPV